MSRRRVVALASALTLLSLVGVVLLVLVAVTQTGFGRERVRRFVVSRLAPAVHGKLYVGHISGNFLRDITVDSLEIRDADDSLFVATGKIRFAFDPRDLLDRRVLIERLAVEHPVVRLQHYADGSWNHKRIFPPGPGNDKKKSAQRGFGEFIVIDTAALRDVSFTLVESWEPSDTLRGAARDSAVQLNLRRTDLLFHRVPDGFTRTWRWRHGQLALSYVRLADPDSVGRYFSVSKLDMEEFYPPFSFRNARGGVKILGDSVWFDIKHFDLPGSTGRATGKVVASSPTRYDVHVIGDSVSLKDVAWVYEDLPTTGGGTMLLDIRTEKNNPSIVDYAITKMDVRSTESHLVGDMTFGVGGPMLAVKDVDMRMEPLDFALLRVFNGKPFPYDFRGYFEGTLKARGGPLTNFRVDEAQFVFHDTNVPGAVTQGRGRGELDILVPAYTKFHGFALDLDQFDLRTIEYLNKSFPRLGGTIAGHAVLDSLYLDPRISDADITHRDGPGEPTRMTGGGRVTFADDFTRYDLTLNAEPLSFTTLARSYPSLALRGSYTGPMRIQGTVADLTLNTELKGPAGVLAYDGHLDVFAPGYSAKGTARVANLDARLLGERQDVPATDLTAKIEADVSGDSLANLAGTLNVALDRSVVDGVRVRPSVAQLAFGNGRVHFDTLRLESNAATLSATGSLGLAAGVIDSLSYRIGIDSLGGVRRWIAPAATAATKDSAGARGATGAAGDSLAGAVTVAGTAIGSIEDIAVAGTVTGDALVYGAQRVKRLDAHFALNDAMREPSGNATLAMDTVTLAGVKLARLGGELKIASRNAASFTLSGASTTGPRLFLGGGMERRGDTAMVALDTAALEVETNDYSLQRPTRIVSTPQTLVIDTMRLHGKNGGSLTVAGELPLAQPVSLAMRADSISLRDLSQLGQASSPFDGYASFGIDVTGTREKPTMTMRGALTGAKFGDVRLDRVDAKASYADERLDATLALFHGTATSTASATAAVPVLSVNASLPVDLALVPVEKRALDAPLAGKIRSDSVGLDVLASFMPSVRDATGKFVANLDLGGTLKRPLLNGSVGIDNAALGLENLGSVRFININADVAFLGDSLVIRRMSAESGEQRGATANLSGVVSVKDYANPRFDVRFTAHNFHVIDRPRVAHLDISTDLHLVGEQTQSTLQGFVRVERGTIYIPELVTKQVISLDDPELYDVVDTTIVANRSLLPAAPPALVQNLAIDNVQVEMGDDVWLRSAEANINLTGSLDVAVRRTREAGRPAAQLALQGVLSTRRGTYRLNLGLVQRTFEVEQGTLRFVGTGDVNPLLDISAVHTVREFGQNTRQDVRVRVTIGGTLVNPTLSLASADSLTISETDLVSYLVTGAPNFALGVNDPATATARLLLRSASAYIGDYLRGRGPFDVVQIQTESDTLAFSQGVGSLGRRLLSNTRLGLGWQLSDRTFVSVNAGLCQVGQFLGSSSGTFNAAEFRDAIGFKVEQRFTQGFGLSFGVEPSTRVLFCGAQGTTSRGFAPTPQQFGFDIFRAWRF